MSVEDDTAGRRGSSHANRPRSHASLDARRVTGSRLPNENDLARLTQRDWSMVAALVFVSVCAWPPWTSLRSRTLTGHWQTGLQLAQARGLAWSHEVMFVYGPLGFIAVPQAWNVASLVFGLIYAGAAVLSVTVVPYWMLSRQGPRIAAFLVAAAIALAAPMTWRVPEIVSLGALILAMSVFQGTVALRLTPLAMLLGGLVAIQALVKPPTAAVAALACGLIVVGPASGVRRRVTIALATLLATFISGWLAAGQSLTDVPEWLASEFDLAGSYSAAMFVVSADHSHEYIATAVLVAGFVAYVARFAIRTPHRSHVILTLVLAVALWITAKEAFVRHDSHSSLFFFAVPLLAAGLLTVRPLPIRPLALLVAGGLVLSTLSTGSTLTSELEPGPSLRSLLRHVTYITLPDQRARATEAARAQLIAGYALPQPVLDAVSGRSVHVDPYETSLAWAYDLQWRPAPIFQRYVAYTARSDAENARALDSDTRAPERVIRRESLGVDGRNILWDSPRYMLELVCHYEEAAAFPPWQVLTRIDPRCGQVRLGTTTTFRANEPVVVPPASAREIVIVWLDLEESRIDRLRTLLFRPRTPILVTADGVSFRVATPEVAGPLLMRLSPAVGWANEFGGATSLRRFA